MAFIHQRIEQTVHGQDLFIILNIYLVKAAIGAARNRSNKAVIVVVRLDAAYASPVPINLTQAEPDIKQPGTNMW